MDWSQIGELLMGGGVIYLIVDRFLLGKRQKVEMNNDILGNGTKLVDIYKQVDEIVTAKTDPLDAKIDKLTTMVQRFGCYREDCNIRVTNPPHNAREVKK
jgi:hypothetical protein